MADSHTEGSANASINESKNVDSTTKVPNEKNIEEQSSSSPKDEKNVKNSHEFEDVGPSLSDSSSASTTASRVFLIYFYNSSDFCNIFTLGKDARFVHFTNLVLLLFRINSLLVYYVNFEDRVLIIVFCLIMSVLKR